jgi:hypothetical protein
VPPEAAFRRTLQGLYAHAFDELADAWLVQTTLPVPTERGSSRVDGKACAAAAG